MPFVGAARPVNTEGWSQIGDLGLALVLSALVGIEREIRQKSAGLRTHTLVGLGAGLFMLVSKYGFGDVLQAGGIVADPSRVAAQIVSGVGFLGAGIIFVRSDAVRGLTTAASIWVTAAIGSTAGANLPILAVAATGMYLIVAVAFTPLIRVLPSSSTATSVVRVRYLDGRGALRRLLREVTTRGFTVDELSFAPPPAPSSNGGGPTVEVQLLLHGKPPLYELASALSDLDDVEWVSADDANALQE